VDGTVAVEAVEAVAIKDGAALVDLMTDTYDVVDGSVPVDPKELVDGTAGV